MAVDLSAGPDLGEWAVMDKGGVVHIAELSGSLPSGRTLCGAVGTAFALPVATERAPRVCERCTDLAHNHAAAR